jgi:hypothetical protein
MDGDMLRDHQMRFVVGINVLNCSQVRSLQWVQLVSPAVSRVSNRATKMLELTYLFVHFCVLIGLHLRLTVVAYYYYLSFSLLLYNPCSQDAAASKQEELQQVGCQIYVFRREVQGPTSLPCHSSKLRVV